MQRSPRASACSAAVSLLVALLVLLAGSTPGMAQFIQVAPRSDLAAVSGAFVDLPVEVDLTGAAGANIASLQFDITWDAAHLRYVGFDQATLPGGWSGFGNDAEVSSGRFRWSGFSTVGTTASFVAVTLRFEALAPNGTITKGCVLVTAAGDEAGTSLMDRIPTPYCTGLCVGIIGLMGNVSGDDEINIIDAQQVARHAIGLPTPNAPDIELAGDVDRDGRIDIIDAQQIARHAIGLPTPNALALGESIPGCPPSSLALTGAGTGSGWVSSDPAGIDCLIERGGTRDTVATVAGAGCIANLPPGTVRLALTVWTGCSLTSWSGTGISCTGTTCEVPLNQARRVKVTLGGIAGDVNGDGCVNVTDLIAVLSAWGERPDRPPEDINRDGHVNSTDLVVVFQNWTGPATPSASATAVMSTSATLNGSANPNGVATTAWFEWGTSPTLTSFTSTAPQAMGSGTTAVTFSAPLSGLTPGATYYARAVAQNIHGCLSRGGIVSFTTPSGLGVVWTGQAGNGRWGDPENWDKGRVPGPADTAYIALDDALVTLDVNATVRALEVTGNGAQFIHNANILEIDSSATFAPVTTYALGRTDSFTSGTLAGAGSVSVEGTLQWTGGRQTGSGTTTVASQATVAWSGAEKHLDGRTMLNDANIDWSLGNLVLWNGAQFINNGRLDWVGTGPGTLFPAIDDGFGDIGTVTNNGVFRNTTSATVQVYVTFNNSGSVVVESGMIHFIRGGAHTGAFTVAAGATLVFAWTTSYPVAHHSFNGSVSGPGTVQFGHDVRFEAGSQCQVSGFVVSRETTEFHGTLEVADSIWVDAGVLELETQRTAVTVPQLMLGGPFGGGGVIHGSDSLIVTTKFVWTGGTLAGAGVTWIRNTATGTWRSSPKTLDARMLINDAALTEWPLGTITLGNSARLLNNGVIDQTASLITDLAAGAGGGGRFTNNGTLRKSGSGSMSIGVAFDNNSLLDIVIGTVTVLADYSPAPSSTLGIGLGGRTPGTQYGRLMVRDAASLGGALRVLLVGGFTPVLNDEFTVLTFGTATGDFAPVHLPVLSEGLAWQQGLTATSMVLAVVGSASATVNR